MTRYNVQCYKTTSLFKVLPVLMSLGMVSGQTAAERLEQGVQLQTAEGDLNAAIEEYKAVLKATAKSQRLAAEARYRLAECFASLGNKELMNAHLKLLREEFPADNKWVVKAATLAPADWEFTARPWKDGQLHIYEIYLPNGTNVGNFLLAERLKDERVDGVKVDELSTARKVDEGPGGKVWESIVVRAAGGKKSQPHRVHRREFAATEIPLVHGNDGKRGSRVSRWEGRLLQGRSARALQQLRSQILAERERSSF
ncbi:MAG: tetratricopeptide repeat protein [Akkermansiaceae bacterium]